MAKIPAWDTKTHPESAYKLAMLPGGEEDLASHLQEIELTRRVHCTEVPSSRDAVLRHRQRRGSHRNSQGVG